MSPPVMMDRRHTHTLTMPGDQIVKYKPQETAYLESNIGVGAQVELDNNNTEKVSRSHWSKSVEILCYDWRNGP